MTEEFFNAVCEACSTIDGKIMEMLRENLFNSVQSPILIKNKIDKILDDILTPFIDPGLIESRIDVKPEGMVLVALYKGEPIITHKTYYKLGDIIKIKLIEILR